MYLKIKFGTTCKIVSVKPFLCDNLKNDGVFLCAFYFETITVKLCLLQVPKNRRVVIIILSHLTSSRNPWSKTVHDIDDKYCSALLVGHFPCQHVHFLHIRYESCGEVRRGNINRNIKCFKTELMCIDQWDSRQKPRKTRVCF